VTSRQIVVNLYTRCNTGVVGCTLKQGLAVSGDCDAGGKVTNNFGKNKCVFCDLNHIHTQLRKGKKKKTTNQVNVICYHDENTKLPRRVTLAKQKGCQVTGKLAIICLFAKYAAFRGCCLFLF
jgi:hypothetical protein